MANDAPHFKAMFTFCDFMGWQSVFFVVEKEWNEMWTSVVQPFLLSEMQYEKLEVRSKIMNSDVYYVRIEQTGYRIIVMYTDPAASQNVNTWVSEVGLNTADRVWLGMEGALPTGVLHNLVYTEDIVMAEDGVAQAEHRLLWQAHARCWSRTNDMANGGWSDLPESSSWNNPFYSLDFINDSDGATATTYWDVSADGAGCDFVPSQKAMRTYDTIMLLARAVDSVFDLPGVDPGDIDFDSPNTVKYLTDHIVQSDWVGATGRINFDPTTLDRMKNVILKLAAVQTTAPSAAADTEQSEDSEPGSASNSTTIQLKKKTLKEHFRALRVTCEYIFLKEIMVEKIR